MAEGEPFREVWRNRPKGEAGKSSCADGPSAWQRGERGHWWGLGLHFGSKKTGKISIDFEDLSRNSVFFEPK